MVPMHWLEMNKIKGYRKSYLDTCCDAARQGSILRVK